MRTNVIFTKATGKEEQKRMLSVSEMCKFVALNVQNKDYSYLRAFIVGYNLDTAKIEERSSTESAKEFVARKIKEQKANLRLSDAEIEQHPAFKYFSSKNKMFELCRNLLPAYKNEAGSIIFAKECKVAVKCSSLEADYYEAYNNSAVWKKQEVITKTYENIEEKETFFVHISCTLNLQEKRMQRRKLYEALEESTTYYRKADNYCKLIELDYLPLSTLFALISYQLQTDAAVAKAVQAKEEEKKKRLEAAKEVEEMHKGNLIQYFKDAEKALSISDKKQQKKALNKLIKDIEHSAKFVDITEEQKEVLNKIKEEVKKK